ARAGLLARTTRKTMARWASNDQGSPRVRVGFGHAEDRQGVAVVERDFDSFADLITAGEVEWDARERGSHFETGKAGGAGGRFAGFEDLAADAAASEIGMDEKGADFGGVGFGIEQFGFSYVRSVGAKEGLAFAPAAAAGQEVRAAGASFGDEVGSIGNQLRVESEYGAQGACDLFGSVVVTLERADGGFNELV